MPQSQSTPLAHQDAEAVGVLRQLARRQAVAEESADGVRILCVAGQGGRASEILALVPRLLWQIIIKKGWAVPHENIEGWRISNAGVIALKRYRSRAGEPGKQGPVVPSSPALSAPIATRPGPQQPGQNDFESPLHWLSRRRDRNGRKLISDAQLAAGERLRADFTLGSMMPSITSSWSPVAGMGSHRHGSDKELQMQDGQLRARERFRAALKAVGPEFCDILVDVCCYLRGLEEIEHSAGWPQRSAKVVLLLGLSALARHYGLAGQAPATSKWAQGPMPAKRPEHQTECDQPLKQSRSSAVASGDP